MPSGSSYLFLNICIALFTIVAIEMIIRWNHISNAYNLGSTSQIIPLVIGVGNLWKVILSLLNELLLDSSVRFLYFHHFGQMLNSHF